MYVNSSCCGSTRKAVFIGDMKMSTVKEGSKFDVSAFVSSLSQTQTKSGNSMLWTLNMDKLVLSQQEILRQPLQLRIIVKALILQKPAGPFTYEQIAAWAVESGLETRQDPMRIVRYYAKQLRLYVLDAAK
jgi:hypothetical protein